MKGLGHQQSLPDIKVLKRPLTGRPGAEPLPVQNQRLFRDAEGGRILRHHIHLHAARRPIPAQQDPGSLAFRRQVRGGLQAVSQDPRRPFGFLIDARTENDRDRLGRGVLNRVNRRPVPPPNHPVHAHDRDDDRGKQPGPHQQDRPDRREPAQQEDAPGKSQAGLPGKDHRQSHQPGDHEGECVRLRALSLPGEEGGKNQVAEQPTQNGRQ